MRGKGFFCWFCLRSCGITPAYAGKRSNATGTLDFWQDHPRVCGEKLRTSFARRSRLGSPPRMRGKDYHPAGKSGRSGITPAYAGKSQTESSGITGRRDHPRVCGEKRQNIQSWITPIGSPPRMRGKADEVTDSKIWGRITPAYAGKRGPQGCTPCQSQDHPRVCGEKYRYHWKYWWCSGSPPRMRGKAGRVSIHLAGRGITPAYAGKRGSKF